MFSLVTLLLLWLHLVGRKKSLDGQSNQGSRSPEEENHRFSRRDVLVRLKSHSATQYAGLYNVMKGVALAAVGFVVVKLLNHEIPMERALLLVIALESVLISYNGEAIGQAIVHMAPATIDVALPMALTVSELLVVGLPSVDRSLGPMPVSWFVAFATWGFLAAILVRSVEQRLDPKLYERCFWPALEAYRARLRFDSKCACATGLITVLFLIASYTFLPSLPEASFWAYGFLTVVAALMAGGLKHHEATRKELRHALIAIADPA